LKPKTSLIAALLLLNAASAPLAAQQAAPHYASEAERARASDSILPLESLALSSDQTMRMTVMVKVGGQGPYAFLVDTGSERTAISRQLAAQLKLPVGVPARVHSVLGSETVATVNIPELGVGSRSLSVIDAPTFEAQHMGAEGILGIDSLRSQRVVFDFKAREMRITPGQVDERSQMEGDAIIVRARSRKGRLVLTRARIDGIPIAVIIDTGAQYSVGNLALMRQLQRASRVRLDRTDLRVNDQSAIMESVTGQVKNVDIARVDRLDLGGVALTDVTVAFASARIFRELGYEGKPALLLGITAMRAFDKVSIDFERKRVRFVLPAA
jgi:predicted aspartyl protease